MPRLIIIMKGISLSYHANDLWNTIFPFGDEKDCHRVRLIEGFDGPGIDLAGRHHEISVTSTNHGNPNPFGYGFDNFLDLTRGYSHGSLRKRTDIWRQHAVSMTVEGAELIEHEPTLCRYQLREKGGGLTKLPDRIAYSGRFDLTADSIQISIPGLQGYDPLPVTKDTIITINNECGGQPMSQNGDLDMLYEFIIEEPQNPARQFAVERDPRDLPMPGQREKSAQNNNTPAFFAGLPCNKFVATVTDGLLD